MLQTLCPCIDDIVVHGSTSVAHGELGRIQETQGDVVTGLRAKAPVLSTINHTSPKKSSRLLMHHDTEFELEIR